MKLVPVLTGLLLSALPAQAQEITTEGPFTVTCDRLDRQVSVIFVNAPDPLVSLATGEIHVVLPLVPSGSGSKYESDAATFWTKGDEAMFSIDGGPDLTCAFSK